MVRCCSATTESLKCSSRIRVTHPLDMRLRRSVRNAIGDSLLAIEVSVSAPFGKKLPDRWHG